MVVSGLELIKIFAKPVNGTRSSMGNFQRENGTTFSEVPFFSRSGTNRKIMFHSQINRNFRNLLVHGKRPLSRKILKRDEIVTCILLTSNQMIFVVQFGINKHAQFFKDYKFCSLWKICSYSFIPNCTRNHLITYRKSYERECITWYMVTSDVLKVLKIARAAGECNLRTWKTSRVTIYHEMHERSYDFLFIIFSKNYLKNKENATVTLLWTHNSEMASKLFQTAHMFYFNQSITALWQVNQACIFRKTLWSDQVFILRAWKIS